MTLIYLFFFLAGGWIAFPFAVKIMQIRSLRRRCRSQRVIALTYDDGPSERLTGQILDLLDEHRALATFFVLGHKVETLRSHANRIVSERHEIGSHSYRHLHAWKRSPVSISRDIRFGLEAVRKIAPCQLFRAPFGKVTLGSTLQVLASGCRLSWWTIDSTDTKKTPLSVDYILGQVRQQGGGVVLMHDLDRDGQPEREAFVLELTRHLLLMAKEEGFRVCTLGDILKH